MTTSTSASITRDLARRINYRNNELKRQALLAVYHNLNLSALTRQRAMEELQNLDRNSSLTRINRRCVLTGRSRGVLRRYKMSRLVFRRAALQGYIPGVFKASW
jgi:small subunit ribosomal protein S14